MIIEQEDECRRQRSNRMISQVKTSDPSVRTYADVMRQQVLEKEKKKTPDPSVRTYADVMRSQALENEEEEMLKAIAQAWPVGGPPPPGATLSLAMIVGSANSGVAFSSCAPSPPSGIPMAPAARISSKLSISPPTAGPRKLRLRLGY
ncbi:hypothetical protein ACOSP7_032038 [Xanthoceras sorbifolium]